MPFFSIIIPVYNVAPYLRECLDSVLAQTFKDWEAICIDDGSTDGSGEILDEYGARDKRFRVLHQGNAGVSAARNRGLEEAKGEWVLFMDPDDFYPFNTVLEEFHKTSWRYQTDLIKGCIRSVDIDGHMISDGRGKKVGVITKKDFDSCYGFQTYVFKAGMLKQNEINFPLLTYYEDPPFLAKVLAMVESYIAIPNVVYGYRKRHDNEPINWLGNDGRKIHDKLAGLNLVADIAEEYDLPHVYANNARHLFDGGTFSARGSHKVAQEELIRFCRRIGSCHWLKLEDLYASFREFLCGRRTYVRNLFWLAGIIGEKLFARFLLACVFHYFVAAPVRRVRGLMKPRSHDR